MKVSDKLKLVTVLPVLLALAVAATLFHVSGYVEQVVARQRAMDGLIRAVFQVNTATARYARVPKSETRQQWLREHAHLTALLDRESADGLKNEPGLQRIRGLVDNMRERFLETAAKAEAATGPWSDLDQEADTLWADSQCIVSEAIAISANTRSLSSALQTKAYMLIVILCALLAGALALIADLASRSVMRGLDRLHEGTRRLAAGDLEFRIETSGRDELDDLAVAFNEMARRVCEANTQLRSSNVQLSDALTRLRRAMDKTIEQERFQALQQVSRGIVHDINDALTPILGFAELYARFPAQAADQTSTIQAMTAIHEAASRAQAVVKSLSEYFAPGSHESIDRVDLAEIAREAVAATQPAWKTIHGTGQAAINIEIRAEATPTLRGNKADLRTALANLILNAVDSITGSGTVTVTVKTEGAEAVVEVADTGAGMAPSVLNRCLEPFFSTRGKGHSGLGLTTTRGIVNRHGGSLSIASRPGEGTKATIRLPIHAQDGPACPGDRPTARAAVTGRRLRVLLVDDEPWITQVLARQFSLAGHDPVQAGNVAQAWAEFQRRPCDLLILDRALPDETGDALANRVRKTSPGTPIIMLTGFGGMMAETGEKPQDVDLVLSKPVTFAKLREAVLTAAGVDIAMSLNSNR